MSQIVFYFLDSTSVLSFYIDIALTLSTGLSRHDLAQAYTNKYGLP